jgi:hypothetical protein
VYFADLCERRLPIAADEGDKEKRLAYQSPILDMDPFPDQAQYIKTTTNDGKQIRKILACSLGHVGFVRPIMRKRKFMNEAPSAKVDSGAEKADNDDLWTRLCKRLSAESCQLNE